MKPNQINYRIVGEEREREFLAIVELSRRSAELPDVRDPDYNLDSEEGQYKVCGKRFDFTWEIEGVLLELDGGQWVKGGGRHNSDADKWKTLEAQALGWRVLHISYTMLTANPWGVMRCLAEVLEAGREGR